VDAVLAPEETRDVLAFLLETTAASPRPAVPAFLMGKPS
jgi:hypothetical protein